MISARGAARRRGRSFIAAKTEVVEISALAKIFLLDHF